VDSVHEPGETGQATGLLGGADDQRADVADGGVDASGEERDVHLGDGQAEAEPPDAKRDGRGDATVDKSKEKDKPTAKKPPTSTPEQAAAFKDACLAASDKGVSYTKAKLGDLVVQVRDLGHVHEIPACTTWLAGYGHITEGVVTIKDDGAGQADGNEAVTDGKEPEPAQEFKWWCTTCEMGFNGTKCSNCHLDVDKIPYEDQWGR